MWHLEIKDQRSELSIYHFTPHNAKIHTKSNCDNKEEIWVHTKCERKNDVSG